ncbi:MAG: DNA polymerase III subunit gamma/tau [Bacteroidetes bacterium]|nr:DNA polymerase III subunit gamma/tau [Bacteroidota bacterium]
MEFQASARKWRPDTFVDVVAQSHVATTLKNAIRKERIGHAYIFSGPRGVGKTTAARIFAKAINCLNPVEGDPCNVCENCVDIKNGRFIDLFEIDGASNNGVDNVREIRDALRYPPQKGKYKTYIIDEVHMLSIGAFNALLKTLEEPPPYAIFIFATTEIHKVPATILSRTQRFDFRRITTSEIMDRLRYIVGEEKINADEEALLIIARKADGAMRDALSILDQLVAFFGKELTGSELAGILNVVEQELFFKVTDSILQKDVKGILNFVQDLVVKGYDLSEFIQGLAEHFRNLLVVVTTGEASLLDISDAYREKYLHIASNYHYMDLIRFLNLLSEAEVQIKNSNNSRLKVELVLSKLCTMEQTVQITQLLQQLNKVEKMIAAATSTRSSESSAVYNVNPETVKVAPPVFQAEKIVSQPKPAEPAPVKAESEILSEPEIKIAPPAPQKFQYSAPAREEKPAGRPTFPAGLRSATAQKAGQADQQKNTEGTATNPHQITITLDEIKERWNGFIEFLTNQQKLVIASVLSHTEPGNWDGKTFTLRVYRGYEKSQIERFALDLSDLMARFYQIRPVIATDFRPDEIPDFMKDDTAVIFEQLKQNFPLVKLITDEFNAELLD